ncbi:YicC/YloC family endoribonuclease [Afifella sp. IM 167]|uniref:YicC/YloC family endoribonuclease n=1 Tax=Afifella sp. IM 167 TaxID=2033586 RepID=UPI001CCC166B|nr:YicC/YloC family endoribonuclease [Afifella sp. IM 167]MBZ8131729.1 YicC family protein [Afifella sp. IM 167]
MTSPIQSMTGFARHAFDAGGTRFVWELKSVNARGLEIRFRLPPGFDGLEPSAREATRKRLTRGSCYFSLSEESGSVDPGIAINQGALAVVLAAAQRLSQVEGIAPARADGILALRGVLVQASGTGDPTEGETGKAVIEGLDEALARLQEARQQEGWRLRGHLWDILDRIEGLVASAEARIDSLVERLQARIRDQVALISSETQLDEARLYQEAVLAATRADIREEIDRLKTHTGEARSRLAEGGVIGRRLDFLAQEFNREANTLCSKSVDHETTAIGLDLKSAIDQLREQVQNLE